LVTLKTVAYVIAVSIMTVAPTIALAQAFPTRTVNLPIIIDNPTIPPVMDLLTTSPGSTSYNCNEWTNSEIDDNSKIVTSQRQCHTQNEQQFHSEQQFQSQPSETNHLLTNLMSNQQ